MHRFFGPKTLAKAFSSSSLKNPRLDELHRTLIAAQQQIDAQRDKHLHSIGEHLAKSRYACDRFFANPVHNMHAKFESEKHHTEAAELSADTVQYDRVSQTIASMAGYLKDSDDLEYTQIKLK